MRYIRRFFDYSWRVIRPVLTLVGGVTVVSFVFWHFLTRGHPNDLEKALGCGEPCVITKNQGGIITVFHNAAELVKKGARKKVIIDGVCASACAYFADKARPHVCVTKNALFRFHQGSFTNTNIQFVLIHSKDIQDWVVKRGGFLSRGFTDMPFSEAKRFWPVCD